VYQGSPLGAMVIPNGSLPLTALVSVIAPALSILAMLPLVVWVNQTVPSGDAAMSRGAGVARRGEDGHCVGGRVEAPDGLGREPGGEPDLPIAAMDRGESLFFDHRDPEWVTRIGTRFIACVAWARVREYPPTRPARRDSL
jgi:hypothetical protein